MIDITSDNPKGNMTTQTTRYLVNKTIAKRWVIIKQTYEGDTLIKSDLISKTMPRKIAIEIVRGYIARGETIDHSSLSEVTVVSQQT